MSTVLTEAALLAFYSTAEAVSIVLFGVGARWAGYLDGTINGRLSRFCMRLLNPALCLSLYSFFSASKLARWWPVLIVATLHIALGALLGRLAGALLLLTPPHRQILVMSVGFANCGAIPFVLVVPLFQQWSRTKDDPEALGDAYSVRGATDCCCHSRPFVSDLPSLQ
jgi:predicted permease